MLLSQGRTIDPGLNGLETVHQRTVVAVGCRRQHGRPQCEVERAHVRLVPPLDLGPLAARELKGSLAHVAGKGGSTREGKGV